jgi:hypothetical protein
VFQADLNGSSLSNVFDMAVDFLRDICSTDNGIRSLTGTINSSNQVTLNFNIGGSFTVTINGTLNSSGLPSFSALEPCQVQPAHRTAKLFPLQAFWLFARRKLLRSERQRQHCNHYAEPDGGQ